MKWIDVKDRLPENGKGVLIAFGKDGISMGSVFKNNHQTLWYDERDQDDGETASMFDPTHWMPLPEYPE